ncbi:MAG: hypothetical protein HYY24_14355 [Verrucomicrobia bacterium]|nr:hypothetical protein [Verrucomicrobiota bacterium]
MIDENTRWAPPEEILKLARESGLTTVEIVRTLSGCLSYREAREVAQEYAPLLGLSVAEFMLACGETSNGSEGFQARNQFLAVTAPTQFRGIHTARLANEFFLDGLEKPVAGFADHSRGFGVSGFFNHCWHGRSIGYR